MCTELQLNVRHLNRWWRHLVNAYDVKTQAWQKIISIPPGDDLKKSPAG